MTELLYKRITFSLAPTAIADLKALSKEKALPQSYCLECLLAHAVGKPIPERRKQFRWTKEMHPRKLEEKKEAGGENTSLSNELGK